MTYAIHVLKVVAGTAIGLVMYGLTTGTVIFSERLIYGLLFSAGLFLAVHGLFTGIEAAVDAGNERQVENRSAE